MFAGESITGTRLPAQATPGEWGGDEVRMSKKEGAKSPAWKIREYTSKRGLGSLS